MVIFEAFDNELILGKSSIKWRQHNTDMTIAVDWVVKHNFEQTDLLFDITKTIVQDTTDTTYKNFLFNVGWLVWFQRGIFSCISHYKSMADNEASGRGRYGPQGHG